MTLDDLNKLNLPGETVIVVAGRTRFHPIKEAILAPCRKGGDGELWRTDVEGLPPPDGLPETRVLWLK